MAPEVRRGTLQPADVRPLLLFHHGPLELGAKGHVIDVVQQDAHHLTGEMLQPGDGDHFTELQPWRETSVQHSCGAKRPQKPPTAAVSSGGRFPKAQKTMKKLYCSSSADGEPTNYSMAVSLRCCGRSAYCARLDLLSDLARCCRRHLTKVSLMTELLQPS